MAEKKAVYRPGWGLEIEGHPFDLEDWESALRPFSPDDHFIDRVMPPDGREAFVLRSIELDQAANSGDAQKIGEALHRRLDALFQTLRAMDRTRAGAIYRFKEGQDPTRIVQGTMHAVMPRFRARGRALAFGPDGKELPPPKPKPSDVQRALKLCSAEAKRHLEDAIVAFGRADNWYDLFKAFEAIGFQAGKGKMVEWGWTDQAAIDRFKDTCHHHRHYKVKLPSNPPTFEEAKSFVRGLLIRALSHPWKGR